MIEEFGFLDEDVDIFTEVHGNAYYWVVDVLWWNRGNSAGVGYFGDREDYTSPSLPMIPNEYHSSSNSTTWSVLRLVPLYLNF